MVKNWTLKNYKDLDRKPLELVNSHGAQKTGYPFAFDFHGQKRTNATHASRTDPEAKLYRKGRARKRSSHTWAIPLARTATA